MSRHSEKKSRVNLSSTSTHVPERHGRTMVGFMPNLDAADLDAYLTRCCAAAGVAQPADLLGWIEEQAAPTIASEEWIQLGSDLAKEPSGEHRLALALHAAEAATKGSGMPPDEEERLVAHFVALFDRAVNLTGGPRPGFEGDPRRDHNLAAETIWYVLVGDRFTTVPWPRCPVVDAAGCPGDPGWLEGMRAAVGGYVRTTIAGATEDDLEALRHLAAATDDEIEDYRPFASTFGEDAPRPELLVDAMADLTRRRATNAQICSGVDNWASAFELAVNEHAIPPVSRLGAIAWFVQVALREEGAAS
jgi:hypothetical protein